VCVCVCIFALATCHAKRMRRLYCHLACLAVPQFSTLSRNRREFR